MQIIPYRMTFFNWIGSPSTDWMDFTDKAKEIASLSS